MLSLYILHILFLISLCFLFLENKMDLITDDPLFARYAIYFLHSIPCFTKKDASLGMLYKIVNYFSYFPRTIRDWNSLPPDIVSAKTLDAFKAQISGLPH